MSTSAWPIVPYRSFRENSARWRDFAFREGDIVISTPAKAGTTWLQMICALLIFQTPGLPAPLGQLSPWLDTNFPPDDVYARLAGQTHRRFIKTHTPLEAIPAVPGVSFVAGARHPLDVAVSFLHQHDNVDRDRFRRGPAVPSPEPPTTAQRLAGWVADDAVDRPESLAGVFRHLNSSWRLRSHGPVILVHYADLSDDLGGQMRRLAGRLGIAVPESRWPELVDAATFTRMREQADALVPPSVLFKSTAAFFRSGRSGEGREALSEQDFARYHARAAELAAPDLLTWLHRP